MSEEERKPYSARVISSIVLAFGAVCSAWIIASSLDNKDDLHAAPSDVARWTVMGTIEGGYNLFDSATGRVCSVPNGSVATFDRVVCTPTPSGS